MWLSQDLHKEGFTARFRSVEDLVSIISDRRALESTLNHAMERLHFWKILIYCCFMKQRAISKNDHWKIVFTSKDLSPAPQSLHTPDICEA